MVWVVHTTDHPGTFRGWSEHLKISVYSDKKGWMVWIPHVLIPVLSWDGQSILEVPVCGTTHILS